MTTSYHCGNQSLSAVNISPATNPGGSSLSAMVTEARSNFLGLGRVWIPSLDTEDALSKAHGAQLLHTDSPSHTVIFGPRPCLLTDLPIALLPLLVHSPTMPRYP